MEGTIVSLPPCFKALLKGGNETFRSVLENKKKLQKRFGGKRKVSIFAARLKKVAKFLKNQPKG